MEVIMLQDVAKVGRKHDVIEVSEGYAINYLIPKGFAKAATAGARKALEMQKSTETAKKTESVQKVGAIIKQLDGKSLTMHRKANEQGHLFAALHSDKINEEIFNQLGVTLPDNVLGDTVVKEVGTFDISLENEMASGTLKVFVERED
jgi:large subunit ribosomal protein L9